MGMIVTMVVSVHRVLTTMDKAVEAHHVQAAMMPMVHKDHIINPVMTVVEEVPVPIITGAIVPKTVTTNPAIVDVAGVLPVPVVQAATIMVAEAGALLHVQEITSATAANELRQAVRPTENPARAQKVRAEVHHPVRKQLRVAVRKVTPVSG